MTTESAQEKPPANNLKKVRQEEGITKTELAMAAQLSVTTISKIEGRRKGVRTETRARTVQGINNILEERRISRRYSSRDIYPND